MVILSFHKCADNALKKTSADRPEKYSHTICDSSRKFEENSAIAWASSLVALMHTRSLLVILLT